MIDCVSNKIVYSMDEDVDDVVAYDIHPCEYNEDCKMLIKGW
jgi:hypothetical protein